MALTICYHGTGEESAIGILRDGFRKGTYFARHLEDAIGFGGLHVFAVVFDKATLPPNWQFTLRSMVSPSRIVQYHVYQVQEMACNKRLIDDVFESNVLDYCDLDN